jgi:phage terminase large subunit
MRVLKIRTPRIYVPLLAPLRYKGAKGGRGSGKSHFFAELWLDENIDEKLDYVCLREHQKSLTFSVKKLLEQKIVAYNAGYYFDVQDKKIATKRGGVTIFEGMQDHTADSIKSLEDFDRAWFEEAQRCSARSLKLLRPTLRKPGSQLWFSWNPEQPTDPIDELLCGKESPPRSQVITANYFDNPFFPDELREEMEYDRRTDPDKYQHVWLGGYIEHSDALVFRNWRVEEFEVDEEAVKRQGADWGYSIDPTTLVQCYIVGRRLYVPYEAYMVRCDVVDTPTLFMTVPDSEKWPITADSARPETIAHMRKNGFPKVMAAIKGARSVEEGIEFLKGFEIIVHPRCEHLQHELKTYLYEVDPLTGKVLPKLRDKNNNVIDALRYACEGARRAKKNEKPKPEEKKAAGNQPTGAQGWMA